ncbi:hypothetical protein SAMN05216420_102245 [Nitrosospira sp. Nl5]|nr:hypothetical protein SAMN05216420_102245 [Nitrosospira sp. Nl5]
MTLRERLHTDSMGYGMRMTDKAEPTEPQRCVIVNAAWVRTLTGKLTVRWCDGRTITFLR